MLEIPTQTLPPKSHPSYETGAIYPLRLDLDNASAVSNHLCLGITNPNNSFNDNAIYATTSLIYFPVLSAFSSFDPLEKKFDIFCHPVMVFVNNFSDITCAVDSGKE